MAVSGAKTGRGRIRVGRGATPTWTELLGVGDFTMPDGQVEDIDVTSHSSPAGELEKVPGLLDRGSVSFSLDFVPGSATDICLKAIKESREIVQLEMNPDWENEDSEDETFAAYLKSYKRTSTVKGVLKSEVEFMIAGVVA